MNTWKHPVPADTDHPPLGATRPRRPAIALVWLLCFLGTSSSQAQIVWTMTTNGTPTSGLSADLTSSNLTAANFNSGSLAFNSTSPSSGYAGASGGANAAVVAKTGSLSAVSTYFEFTLTPSPGYQISATGFSLATRSTGTGPKMLTLFSSEDNYTTALGFVEVLANSTWKSVTLGDFSATGDASHPLTFRLFGSGGTGSPSGANWRIDDLAFSATALAPPPAIPEPSTYALWAGLLTFAVVVWRRRKRPLPAGARAPDNATSVSV